MKLSKSKLRVGQPNAKWLLKIEDGEYTADDLVKISKKSKSSVHKMMAKYSKEVIISRTDTNRIHFVYVWNKKHYLDIIKVI